MYEKTANVASGADCECVAPTPNVGALVRAAHDGAGKCVARAEAMVRLISGDSFPPLKMEEPKNLREDLMQLVELISRTNSLLEMLSSDLGA